MFLAFCFSSDLKNTSCHPCGHDTGVEPVDPYLHQSIQLSSNWELKRWRESFACGKSFFFRLATVWREIAT